MFLTAVQRSAKRKSPLVCLPVFLRSMANLEHGEDNPKHVRMSGETPDVSVPDQAAQETPAPVNTAAALPLSIPSFAAASELLSAPYSCLVVNTHRRHIALPPVYLNKKKTGIKEELEAELLKFSQRCFFFFSPADVFIQSMKHFEPDSPLSHEHKHAHEL